MYCPLKQSRGSEQSSRTRDKWKDGRSILFGVPRNKGAHPGECNKTLNNLGNLKMLSCLFQLNTDLV